ncbi:hypothetical protein CR203_01060 [Salipaludibacillus neizhouensis]|uniref:Uncharacterized protein n=1 Tax=Salipaludibacillus neizhouensis TaxID=885475 RepID=A0A3A9KDN6_9BACI|nr:hypothetical protein [Salipaludibacillus neizhouensis]RKL68672.1 hypothetical protein CR203_01060 [Salipaludibacillus neizhouensis]
MEGIFQLLQESPLILFFIIAALISFFRGSAKKNAPEQGQSQHKSETDNRKQEVDWKDIFRQEERSADNYPQERQAEDHSNDSDSRSASLSEVDAEIGTASHELQERYNRLQERKKQAMKRAGEVDDSAIGRPGNVRSPKVRLDFSRVSGNDAVKGVIWAEILGKPKGRRRP